MSIIQENFYEVAEAPMDDMNGAAAQQANIEDNGTPRNQASDTE